MLIKKGSQGEIVKEIQIVLGINDDGIFGPNTEKYVKLWQTQNGLVPDGIVGPKTLNLMGLLETDNLSKDVHPNIQSTSGIKINKSYMNNDEFFSGSNPSYIFLHHTAGWHNPYNQVQIWDLDTRGQIGTEFVIGGQSIKGNNFNSDGVIVQAFPHKSWAWHLGIGRTDIHKNSVGIELCNFGWVVDGKTWESSHVDESQIVELKERFRGYKYWHRYTNKQINTLKDLLLFIANRDNINLREGLPTWIRSSGAKAFEYSHGARRGLVRGLLSHSNVRKDKFDIFPQPEIMDMLMDL